MSANAVAIVGGGAVGAELAGEISSAYPSIPRYLNEFGYTMGDK